MEDFLYIAFLVVMVGLLCFGTFVKDFLIYKHRGFVQPDDEDDTTIITGPSDASAHWQVDRFKPKNDQKK